MESKRILLMYISEVSGHREATRAIEQSLRTLSPDSEIKNINGFRYVSPLMEKIVNKAYMGIIKRTPKIWDYMYDNSKIIKSTQSIKKIIHKSNHKKLAKLFNEFSPSVIVCTQAFPCGLCADYKTSHGVSTKLIGVLTDHAPHRFWLYEGVDHYIVPSDEIKERFIQNGIKDERIKVLGIPVAPKFTTELDKRSIAEKLGLRLEIPTVLIMGGGQGLGPIKKIVKSLNFVTADFQLVVVAGTNKKLIAWLKKFHSKSLKKMLVYEYVNNIEELMDVASVLITKAGGMTITEALTKGLPMIIINPLPGQESYNTKFLLANGAAVRIDNLSKIGIEVESLLHSNDRLEKMKDAAINNSKPNSALDIARLVLN